MFHVRLCQSGRTTDTILKELKVTTHYNSIAKKSVGICEIVLYPNTRLNIDTVIDAMQSQFLVFAQQNALHIEQGKNNGNLRSKTATYVWLKRNNLTDLVPVAISAYHNYLYIFDLSFASILGGINATTSGLIA